jgi:segregation and condensation protein A
MEPDQLFNNDDPQERIFNILFKEDEITWQNIIYDLVRTEEMDPWDVDVSILTQRFLEMLKKLKEMDFRISGKVVLAAAILLKIKSDRFVDEDINALDNLMSSMDDPDVLLDELEMAGPIIDKSHPPLLPKTPQPRKRKVSVYDLIEALEKALEVENRRPPVKHYNKFKVPDKKMDISEVIKDVYDKVHLFYTSNGTGGKLTFSKLIPSDSKEDKVYTFIPLLHLENQRKVDMFQQFHFGEIEIGLAKPRPPEPAPTEGEAAIATPEQAPAEEVEEEKEQQDEKPDLQQ